MKLPDISYERPADLSSALTLLSDNSRDIRVLAGGQSLLAALNFRLGDPDLLVDINRIAGLSDITDQGQTIRIGALARHRDVQQSKLIRQHLPLIGEAINHVAHPAIRNRGTFGGSIALADPAAEMPACLLATNGTVVTASSRGERRIGADDFFKGLYETALDAGEIITAVEFNKPNGTPHRCAFNEVSRRHGDYAMAGVAICGCGANASEFARIVLFGISDRPVRASAAEAVLTGQALDKTAIQAAADLATDGIEVFGDVHASVAMKRHLARVVTRRALTTLAGASA